MCYIPPKNRFRQPQPPLRSPYLIQAGDGGYSQPSSEWHEEDPTLAALITSYPGIDANILAMAFNESLAAVNQQQQALAAQQVAESRLRQIQFQATQQQRREHSLSPTLPPDLAPPSASLSDTSDISDLLFGTSDFSNLIDAVADSSVAQDTMALEAMFSSVVGEAPQAWETKTVSPQLVSQLPPQTTQFFPQMIQPQTTSYTPATYFPTIKHEPSSITIPETRPIASSRKSKSPASSVSPPPQSPFTSTAASPERSAVASGAVTKSASVSGEEATAVDWSDSEVEEVLKKPVKKAKSGNSAFPSTASLRPDLPASIVALLPSAGHGLKNDPLRTADPEVLSQLLAPTRRRKAKNNEEEEGLPEELVAKRQKNTEAARRSRLRKCLKIDTLERQCQDLQEVNDKLVAQLAALEEERNAYRRKNEGLEKRCAELEWEAGSSQNMVV